MPLTGTVEVVLPLIVSCFFSAFYEFDRREMLWAGIVAMGCWLVTGMVYLITSSYPVISLVFLTVGIIYVIRILIDLFRPLRDGRRLEGDVD